MKDVSRQAVVAVTVLATIVVNILADALPINGLNTAAISNSFHIYFVPAGYVFSIWGLIYIGLIAYAAYQALPSQRENPRLRATGWWISLGGLANIAWIFFWHYELFPLTLVAMLVLLATLLITYLGLRRGQTAPSAGETWAVRIPFSLYLGWITVATIANVSDVLWSLQWNGFGITPEAWMLIMLIAVFAIASWMNLVRRDVAFTLVIVWALAGIVVQQSAVALVANAAGITAVLVVVTLVLGLFPLRPREAKRI
ncbi:MAG: TspO/MBR family protein [Anaerolineales bacterium]